jgi:hypothetical protein
MDGLQLLVARGKECSASRVLGHLPQHPLALEGNACDTADAYDE